MFMPYGVCVLAFNFLAQRTGIIAVAAEKTDSPFAPTCLIMGIVIVVDLADHYENIILPEIPLQHLLVLAIVAVAGLVFRIRTRGGDDILKALALFAFPDTATSCTLLLTCACHSSVMMREGRPPSLLFVSRETNFY